MSGGRLVNLACAALKQKDSSGSIAGLVCLCLMAVFTACVANQTRQTTEIPISPSPMVMPQILPSPSSSTPGLRPLPLSTPSAGGAVEQMVLGWGRTGDIAWMPDGERLLVGVERGIYIYDADTYAPLLSWSTPVQVGQLALSPRGNIVATISSDARSFAEDGQKVYLWETRSGRSLGVLEMERHWKVADVVFSPDGATVATSLSNCSRCPVLLWDLTTGEPWARLHGYEDWVSFVTFDPGGQWLATGDHDGQIVLWSLETKRRQVLLDGYSDWVGALVFSPQGHMLAAALEEKVRLWQVSASGVSERYVWNVDGRSSDLAFSPDGHALARVGRAIEVWDVENGERIATLDDRGRSVSYGGSRIAWSPDGDALAVLGGKGVSVWEPMAAVLHPYVIVEHTSVMREAAFSPDGDLLVSLDGEGLVLLRDGRTLTVLGSWRSQDLGFVEGLALSPDGSLMATWENAVLVNLWETMTGTQVDQLRLPGDVKSVVTEAAFRPLSGEDQLTLATGSRSGEVYFWDISTRLSGGVSSTRRAALDRHSAPVTHLAFDRDGRWLASADEQGGLHLWNAEAGDSRGWLPNPPTRTLTATTGLTRVTRLAFSPDGTALAASFALGDERCGMWEDCSANDAGLVRVWDLATRQILTEWRIPEKKLRGLTWGPDGHWLATFEDGGLVRLWDPVTGQELAILGQEEQWGRVGAIMVTPECVGDLDADVRSCRRWLTIVEGSFIHFWETP